MKKLCFGMLALGFLVLSSSCCFSTDEFRESCAEDCRGRQLDDCLKGKLPRYSRQSLKEYCADQSRMCERDCFM